MCPQASIGFGAGKGEMSILLVAGLAWLAFNVLLVVLLATRVLRRRYRTRRLWSVGHKPTYLSLKRY